MLLHEELWAPLELTDEPVWPALPLLSRASLDRSSSDIPESSAEVLGAVEVREAALVLDVALVPGAAAVTDAFVELPSSFWVLSVITTSKAAFCI